MVLQGSVRLDGSQTRELEAVDARIEVSLYLRNGFTANRGLRGLGMVVTGSLSARKSVLTAPPDSPGRAALDIFRSSVGDLFLNGARLTGGVSSGFIPCSSV